ncbi:MAG TPA: phosphonate C-P lyase system protein PhnG [Candidatus Cybelea sp.]|nr:phosphonate C-P lyase system protein PhnG [Candidatus Cybelea sp.]
MTSERLPDAARAHWISTLSLARLGQLESFWESLAPKPEYRWLRPAESGLVMLRGRAGGNGQAFNFGEMTMTRAAVVIDGPQPITGFGYVAGRNARHAELAALFDALLQDEARRPILLHDLIAPIEVARKQAQAARSAAVAATRVDFTTMVRGDA